MQESKKMINLLEFGSFIFIHLLKYYPYLNLFQGSSSSFI